MIHKGFVVNGEAGAWTLKNRVLGPTRLIHSLAPPRVQRQTAAVGAPLKSTGPRQSSGLFISEEDVRGELS